MEKPMFIVKPNIINSLVPIFIKETIAAIPISIMVYLIMIILSLPKAQINFWLILIISSVLLVPLLIRTTILKFTNYIFYRNYVINEFRLIFLKKHSLPYRQITNIRVDVSLWDRICHAGDIVLHTAENKAPDLILKYIKYPEKIERYIYQLMRRYR